MNVGIVIFYIGDTGHTIAIKEHVYIEMSDTDIAFTERCMKENVDDYFIFEKLDEEEWFIVK